MKSILLCALASTWFASCRTSNPSSNGNADSASATAKSGAQLAEAGTTDLPVMGTGNAGNQQLPISGYPREAGAKTIQFCKKFPAGYKPRIPGADEWNNARKFRSDDYTATLYQPYKDPDGKPLTPISWSQYSDALTQICKDVGGKVRIDLPGKASDGLPILKEGPWSTSCKTNDAGETTCCNPRMAFTCYDGANFEDQPTYDSVLKGSRKYRGTDLKIQLQKQNSTRD